MPQSTDLVTQLEATNAGLEQRIANLRKQQRDNELRIDDIHRSQRPNFPTPHQRELIALALEKIDQGLGVRSHLGDPALDDDYSVVVHPVRRWISIKHLAPYARRHRGDKLWHFTDEEIEEFFSILNEAGYPVVEHWPHDEGISIVVGPKGSA